MEGAVKLWKCEQHLLTAVVCCYNKLDFVKRAVESIVEYKGIDDEDIKVVLWDQASPYPGVREYLEKVDEETGDWLEVQGVGFNVGVGTALNNVNCPGRAYSGSNSGGDRRPSSNPRGISLEPRRTSPARRGRPSRPPKPPGR